jgi:hypothetical protein
MDTATFELVLWVMAMSDLWETDPELHTEFLCLMDFVDFARYASKKILREALYTGEIKT